MLKQEAPIANASLSAMQTFLHRVPPHLVIRNFLGAEVITALLQHAIANEARFTMTKVGEREERRTDTAVRISKRLREIGSMRSTITLYSPQAWNDGLRTGCRGTRAGRPR
jgi:hypothetical protein